MTATHPGLRESLLGLACGITLGLCGLVVLGLDTRFAVYGVIALVGCALLPAVVRRAGSLEAFLFFVMVASLQLDVAMAFAYQQKIAGPYGFLVSPILLAAVALLALRVVTASRQLAPRLVVDWRLVGWLAVFGLAGLLSVLNAPSKRLVAFGLFEIMTLGLIAMAAVDQCARPGGVAIVQRGLVATLVVQSLLIIVSFTTGVQVSPSHGVRGGDYGWAVDQRFSGTLNTPSAAATMLVVCLLLLVARLASGVAGRGRSLSSWEMALGAAALLLTKTRTAWIGMAVGSAGLVWTFARRGRLATRRLLVVGMVGLASLLVALPLVAQRLSASHADAEIRWRLVKIAAAMIADHPLIGIGLNTATNQVYAYVSHTGLTGWFFIVHNQFLLVWAETGILGIVGFVALCWLGVRAASRLSHAEDPETQTTGAWLYWSLLALVWALNLDHVSGTPTYKLVFLLLGAALGAARCQAAGATSAAAPAGAAARRAA